MPTTQLIKLLCISAIFHMGIESHVDAQHLKDTADQKSPKFKYSIGEIFFAGMFVNEETKRESWLIPPVFQLIQFNTVEGAVIHPKVTYMQYLAMKNCLGSVQTFGLDLVISNCKVDCRYSIIIIRRNMLGSKYRPEDRCSNSIQKVL